MFGAISEKSRTFDTKINFAIPPIFHFCRWLGEFFSFFQSYEISITLSINSLEKPKTFGHFTTVPKYQKSPESCIIPQITPKFERLVHLSATVHEQSPRNSLSRTRRPPLTFWYSEGA